MHSYTFLLWAFIPLTITKEAIIIDGFFGQYIQSPNIFFNSSFPRISYKSFICLDYIKLILEAEKLASDAYI